MKNKANKKKIIVLVSMILLLAATGFLNYYLNTRPPAEQPEVTATYFSSYRLDRDNTRVQNMDMLEQICNSETSTADDIAAAKGMQMKLVETSQAELILEGLIKARGFEDCIVTIGLYGDVNVLVKGNPAEECGLSYDDESKILDIVCSQLHNTPGDVIVVPTF